ncbi:MAG: GIY-YIG nuclease family protein [Alphaproteobacteria bacterium]|nr:GIY-YIG nuclease family protein [Alphaproteobacteria bacterium]
MKYVYILQSLSDSNRYYTGITDNLKDRIESHNAGRVTYTSRHRPWRLNTYVAFSDEKRAFEFEKYLKSSSGRALAKKRL